MPQGSFDGEFLKQLATLNSTMKVIAEDIRWLRLREEARAKAAARMAALGQDGGEERRSAEG